MFKIIIKKITLVLLLIGVIYSLASVLNLGVNRAYAALIGGTIADASLNATELTHSTEKIQLYTGTGSNSDKNIFKFTSDMQGDCNITLTSVNSFSYIISGDGIFANSILSTGNNTKNINYTLPADRNHVYYIKIYSEEVDFIGDLYISSISTLSYNEIGGAKIFSALFAGYGAGTQEEALTINVTATGVNKNVNAVLSGAGSYGFDLVENISDLEDNTSGSFTVRPKSDLDAGTYNGIVKITSDEFPEGVTFTVTQVINSVLIHNVDGGAKTFRVVSGGYESGSQEAALTVLVIAKGGNTAVNAALTGVGAAGFDLVENISDLLNNTTGTFTVRTKNGLAAGTYNATVTITSTEFPIGVTFTVTQVVNSGLTHDVAGNSKSFRELNAGYGEGTQEAALTVTVTAKGANTAVNAVLSEEGASYFDLVENLSNLANNATGTFTVRPKNGLELGEHSATVTITSNEFPIGVTFTITQMVKPSLINSVPGGVKVFRELSAGYNREVEPPFSVKVTAIGNNVAVKVVISGVGADAFDIYNNMDNVLVDINSDLQDVLYNNNFGMFIIRIKNDLAAGTYSLTVKITSDQMPEGTTFTVIQVVKPVLTHSVEHSSKLFQAMTEGYGPGTQETLTVTVTAKGANTAVNAALSGAGAGGFDLVENISDLANNATGTFTIRPKNGLAVGTYVATVTINSNEFPTGVNFEVKVYVQSPPQDLSHMFDSLSSASDDDTSLDLSSHILSGIADLGAILTTTTTGSITTTTVVIDDNKVAEELKQVGNNSTIVITVNNNSNVVVGQLNGQSVKNMENKEAVLEISTENITYTLPASQINIDQVSSQLGEKVELKDIIVSVTIAEPSKDTVRIVEDTANKNSYQIITKPIEFEISCTSGGKTVDVSKFNGYVERTIAIPDGIDPSKITTGIVLNKDGTLSHVPTTIIKIGDKYFAKISSLTNSIYSVIWNPITFKDIQKHYARSNIEDIASRLIMSGVNKDSFGPDKDITRGEFVDAIVKALGLMRVGTGKDIFSDVTRKNNYYDSVSSAFEYNIIKGYGDHTFSPDRKISREEAMVILVSAMSIVKLDIKAEDKEIKEFLAKFKDGGVVANFAKGAAAVCIREGIIGGYNGKLAAKKNITRAEAATCIYRLLQKAKLVL